jgi:hypothetical protein
MAVPLELHGIVIVKIINSKNLAPLIKQALGKMETDEPGRACDENFHTLERAR